MLGLLLILAVAESQITVPIEAVRGFSPKKLSHSVGLNQTTLIVRVENRLNLQYNTIFLVGSKQQKLSLKLDTGSSWTWFPGTTCDGHNSTKFNSSASSAYSSTSESKTFTYGSGTVSGYLSKDFIWIDSRKIKNKEFILSYKETNLDDLLSDGVAGLGFNLLSENYPTLIDALYDQKVINEKVFALYLNNKNYVYLGSSFSIGSYNASLYGKGDAKTVTIDSSAGYWVGVIQQSAFEKYSWAYEVNGYFDTGNSAILGPFYEIYYIKQTILAQTDGACTDNGGFLVCDCQFGKYENYPDLVFTIDDQTFTVAAKDYIDFDQNICTVLIDTNDEFDWILGQPFFRAYYSIFNMHVPQILFYKAADGKTSETVPGPSEFYLLGISACGLIALTIGGLYYKNSKKTQEIGYNRLV